MTKVDLKKELKHLYSASAKEVTVVEVPTMNFLMVDGAGDPNTAAEFKEAVEALYSLSYTLKFMLKRAAEGIDYGVLPLEGLFRADDMSAFCQGKKEQWKWTLMIAQPPFVTLELVNQALEQVMRKKELAGLSRVRFESFDEGLSAQIMHIGPYAEEGPTIGKHHEIYLSDPNRSKPEKLKTIIRQPVK